MLHDKMNIYHLMVHAQQVEETRFMRKSRNANRTNSFDGSSLKGSIYIQDKLRLKKRFSNQVPSDFPRARDDKITNPKFRKEKSGNSPS